MSSFVDAKPDLDRIQRLSKQLEAQYRVQHTEIDQKVMDFYLLKNQGDAAVTKAMQRKKIKPVRTGLLTRRIDRDFNLTLQAPTIRMNPRTASDRDATLADEKFEPWLAGAWRLSQVDDVWTAKNRSLHILGRAVSYLSPVPSLWSSAGPYKKLLKRLQDASDPDAIARALTDIEQYKLRNFPIRWYPEPARSFMPVLSVEYELPETVKKKKMTKLQILTDFGEAALPRDYRTASDDSELDVILYDNMEWHVAVVASVGDPRVLREPWQHGMEMNPHIFMELERLDANEYGYYWKGSMFSVIEMAETFDEFMTDLRHNVRENTIRGRSIKLDPEARGVSGPPPKVEIGPGQDWVGYIKEELGLVPAPDIHPQAFALAQLLISELDKAMTISALDEQARSGHSAATYTEGIQVARSRFNSVQEAQARAARGFALRALSSVVALSKNLNPEEAETINVVMGRDENMRPKGSVGLAPKDVEGWISEALIEPQFGPGLLTAQNLLLSMAIQLSSPPLNMPLEYTLPFFGVENARYWIEKIEDKRLDETYVEPAVGQLVTQALLRAGMDMSPEEMAKLARVIGNLTPEAQAALLGGQPAPPPAPEAPVGPGGTMAENTGRTGEVQTPPPPAGVMM